MTPRLPSFDVQETLADERKLAQPLSIECEHGVCDRWRNWWNTGFPKAAGIIATRHEIDFNLRHVTHAEHLISVEIGLLNRAVLNRNRAVKGCAQAIGDRAFTLRLSAVGIDDHAAIYRGEHALDLGRAIGFRGNLRNLSYV